MPVLKCPYLAQLTLQQVRASAPNIINKGAASCPIFGNFMRKVSTTAVNNATSLNVSTAPINFDEIAAVHAKIRGSKKPDYIKIPTKTMNKSSSLFDESKNS